MTFPFSHPCDRRAGAVPRLALGPPEDGPPVVHLRGELDVTTQDASRAALRPCTATGAVPLAVVVTSDVTFVDCAGLRPLREAAAALALRGGRLVLAMPSRSVERLVRLTGTSPGLALPDGR